MDQIEDFRILLSNDVIRVDSIVTGSVKLKIRQEFEMKEIRLEVEGKANTDWTEQRSYKSGKNTYHFTLKYSGSENYCDFKIPLWPNDSSNVGSKIYPTNLETLKPEREYEFPFSFKIPDNCPSSFSGEHGKILYSCKAVIEPPTGSNKISKICQVPLTVAASMDLNFVPSALQQIKQTKLQKTCYFFCLFSGEIQCDIDIPRGGFMAGEKMPLNFIIVNNSWDLVTDTRVRLIEKVSYRGKKVDDLTTENTKLTTRTLVELYGRSVHRGESQNWQGRHLTIPPVCATSNPEGGAIIAVCYELELKIYHEKFCCCCVSSFKVVVPIFIGNVPFGSLNIESDVASLQQPSISPEHAPLLLPGSADLPPPSYEETLSDVIGAKSSKRQH